MAIPDPTLTEAAVRELARPQSYDRGENYYDEGAVVEIIQRGETLRAAVEGSQYEPYQARIELDETYELRVVQKDGEELDPLVSDEPSWG